MLLISAVLCGSLFFPSIFFFLNKYFTFYFGDKLPQCNIYDICIRCVSSVQAVLSCTAGFIIIQKCNDIMYDSYWLTNTYASFAVPYFGYDLWVMFRCHLLSQPVTNEKTLKQQFVDFVSSNKLMTAHHVLLPCIFFPIIIFFRNDKGDFFVGVFYLFEMAIPFIAARFILIHLKLKETPWYVLTSLMMIVAFAISRVAIFPYLYWAYSNYANISLWSVPLAIPVKCNVGCLFILLFQLYWLFLMVRGAFRAFRKMYKRRQNISVKPETNSILLGNQSLFAQEYSVKTS